MPRTRGARNEDYAASRDALVRKLWPRLARPEGLELSFRELAAAAEVSPATLRHYFKDSEGVLRAVMETQHRFALVHLAEAAVATKGDVRASLGWLLRSIVEAWQRFGVGRVHALGIAAGLSSLQLGPTYVNEILEPTLQAAEARIALHVASGELERCDVRHAALELLSPVVLGLLHQDSLGGKACRPLRMQPFLDDHLGRFLRAFARPAASQARLGRN